MERSNEELAEALKESGPDKDYEDAIDENRDVMLGLLEKARNINFKREHVNESIHCAYARRRRVSCRVACSHMCLAWLKPLGFFFDPLR